MGAAPDAVWPAISAIVVAFFGLLGVLASQRRRTRRSEEDDDAAALSAELNLVRSMSLLLEERDRRILNLERRLAACEAREKARGL